MWAAPGCAFGSEGQSGVRPAVAPLTHGVDGREGQRPDNRRIAEKLAASISPPPSAAPHRTELAAKATIAAVVRRLTYLTRFWVAPAVVAGVGPFAYTGGDAGVGALIQRGGRAVAGMLPIATAGGS